MNDVLRIAHQGAILRWTILTFTGGDGDDGDGGGVGDDDNDDCQGVEGNLGAGTPVAGTEGNSFKKQKAKKLPDFLV